MARLQTVPIPYNGDGVNTYNRPDKIQASEMRSTSRNIRLDAEMFRPRKGYTAFADEQSGNVLVDHIAYYKRKLVANDRLMMFTNNVAYSIDPTSASTWTALTSGASNLTDTTNVETVNFGDWLFVFNGVDTPLRIEGTSINDDFTKPDSLSAAAFLPAFGEAYNGSLFVAGVPTAPNNVYISKASTAANPEYVYNFSGAATSYGDADVLSFPSRVTALRKLSTALVVFTVDGAWYIPGLKEFGSSIVFEVQPIAGAEGAVSQKSTVVVENDIYYLTPQKEIRSIRRGFSEDIFLNTTPLSIRIQKFLDEEMDQDQLSKAFGIYNSIEKEYHLYFTQTDSAVNTLRIVGDITKIGQDGVPQWMIDDACPFSSGVVYKGKTYCGSAAKGQVYQVNNGFADDDESNILATRVSKDFDASNPLALKNYRLVEVFGEMTTTTSIAVSVYVDDNLYGTFTINSADIPDATNTIGGIGTESIGDFPIGEEAEESFDEESARFEFIKRMPVRALGRKMRIEFTTDGVNQDYRIRHMQYHFIARGKLFNSVVEK